MATLASNTERRSGDYAGTPVGYYTPGRVFPRERRRTYEVFGRRRRVLSVGAGGGITFNASVLAATATLEGTPVQRNTTIQVNA